MPISLVSTKLHIPRGRANGISRPRLTHKLIEVLKHPGCFALISGPAGFGKTTLLSEFAAELRNRAAWVALEDADNDPIQFWTYLITACQSIHPNVGESALALFQSNQPLPDETIPTIIINDLVKVESDLVLVLDDYHAIQNASIHAAVSYLLEHLPEKFHLVLSTRVDPPMPLARYRARGQLIEIRAADLRFTTEEAASFLNQMMGLNLSSEQVSALEARTEGWIAGLQLAALSMRGRDDIASFIKAFTGSHVYVAEYLIEEVLRYQTEEVKSFLLQTSILERLTASLCEAVSGCIDGQAMLRELQQANLFVLPLDDEGVWFRYHHLFADLLKARLRQSLSAEAIAALHQRAMAWYEQAGMIPEAIEHSLAISDYPHVVKLLERIALPTILQAHVKTVDRWLKAIPSQYVDQSPRINMAFAWLNLLRGTSDQAKPYLGRLAIMFSSEASDWEASLQGEWLAIQSKLLGMQGKAPESRDLAQRALQILPEADVLVRTMLYLNLADACEQMHDYDGASETFQMIARDAQARGDFATEIIGASGLARMLLLQGRLHSAFETAMQGVQRLESTGQSTPFSATFYGELGQIHYHWHQLDQARNYSLRSIQVSGVSGYSDPEIYHHVMLARIFQMEGDWESSAREMQQADELTRKIPPAMVREQVISQQIRVDLARDHLPAAQAAMQSEGFTFDGVFGFPVLAPDANVLHPLALLYNSALRILLYRARMKDGIENLQRGLELAELVLAGELRCSQIPAALETLLLRSQMKAVLGDRDGSLADAVRALELAQPEGFISVFLEEGPPVAESLKTLLERDLLGTAQKEYVKEILSAFPVMRSFTVPGNEPTAGKSEAAVDESLALIEPLTSRELEVLRLIACGDSNQKIAEKLVITLSAVKKHTSNIFRKLNVNSRTQAIVRARQLGILREDD